MTSNPPDPNELLKLLKRQQQAVARLPQPSNPVTDSSSARAPPLNLIGKMIADYLSSSQEASSVSGSPATTSFLANNNTISFPASFAALQSNSMKSSLLVAGPSNPSRPTDSVQQQQLFALSNALLSVNQTLATDLLKQAVARVPQAKVRILVRRYINSIHVNSISKHEHPLRYSIGKFR